MLFLSYFGAMIYTFSATIHDAGGGGCYVEIPLDVKATFGKSRVPVHATLGGLPYTGTLVKMGGPCHILPVLKAIREQLGLKPGDTLTCTIAEDTTPRTVAIPADVQQLLAAHPQQEAFFASLSYTHQREYVRWIEEAKRPETRQRRLEKTLEMLQAGQKSR